MNNPALYTEDSRELTDLLIAISVVSRHLARKLEMKGSEDNHEPNEQPGNHPRRTDRNGRHPG